jgi:hypothetical protein
LAVGSSLLNRQDAKDAKESEETTNRTEIPLASPSVKATTLQKKNFVFVRVFRG